MSPDSTLARSFVPMNDLQELTHQLIPLILQQLVAADGGGTAAF